MLKLVLIGVWACVMTLASSYAASYWKASQVAKAGTERPVHPVEFKKTREFTVPKIADGAIQGYIITQLTYSLDTELIKNNEEPAEAFLLDEAFRAIYADDTIDFSNLKKYDLTKFAKTLVQGVNTRMNAAVVKDVLILEFNYMTKADMKKQL
ncbi:MAG: hypothetical protein ABR970_07640 [Roseiarcus sp.]|jgi:flagellar basal body-associated protein FliL